MGKVYLGVKNPKAYNVPDFKRIVRTTKNESIFIFGSDEKGDKMICAGIGQVRYVQKGEKMDIVGIHFGSYVRQVIVVNNHARRQIYGLKKTQLCWFYGYYKVYNEGSGKVRITLFAKGFLPWYVPKAMDIKNYDLDTLEELEKDNETIMLNFIDDLMEGD